MTTHTQPFKFHLLLRLQHWLMAVLILAMLFVGVGMVSTARPTYLALLSLHRPLGVAILLLAIVRLVTRRLTTQPALPADLPRWQGRVAKASHVLLYASMLGMPLIGWAMVSAGGFPVTLWPGVDLPPIMPHNLALYALLHILHMMVAFAFFALILGHLAAALYHAIARRDGVLSAMTWGGDSAPDTIRVTEESHESGARD